MNKPSPQTVLVTGAAGFTGSHLARRLAEQGDRVRVLVRPGSRLEALAGVDVEPVHADLSAELPAAALRGVDTVYHVAAVYRKEGVPRDYFFQVNAGGTERVLQAALQAGVGRFVHVSTVGVLGDVKNPPADEEAPPSPHDVYQESKWAGEQLARRFHAQHGLPVCVVRPGAIYGPGDLRFLKLFRAINRGLFRLIGPGENYYHLVYIDDLVDGILLAGSHERAPGEVFILAGEQPIQVKDLVQMIGDVLGRKVPGWHVPVAPVMLAANIAQKVFPALGIEPPLYPRRLDFFISNRSFSIAKARRVLGYQPAYSLKTGLACTAEWYREQNLL